MDEKQNGSTQEGRFGRKAYEVAGAGGHDAVALIKALEASRSVAIGLRSLLSILQENLSRHFYEHAEGKPMDPTQADALFELAGASLDLLNDKLEHVADTLACRDQGEQEST